MQKYVNQAVIDEFFSTYGDRVSRLLKSLPDKSLQATKIAVTDIVALTALNNQANAYIKQLEDTLANERIANTARVKRLLAEIDARGEQVDFLQFLFDEFNDEPTDEELKAIEKEDDAHENKTNAREFYVRRAYGKSSAATEETLKAKIKDTAGKKSCSQTNDDKLNELLQRVAALEVFAHDYLAR